MALDDSYSKVLLHFDGADESTTFTDESGKVWTAHGTAQIDTAQYVWVASGLFDGNSDYIDTPDHAEFNLSNNDFTVDFRLRPHNLPLGATVLFEQYQLIWEVSAFSLYISMGAVNSHLYFECNTVEENQFITHGQCDFVMDTWYHVAIIRYAGNLQIYLNGVAVGNPVSIGTDHILNGDSVVRIGANLDAIPSKYLNGWVEEFRFSNGIARWTGNFTPSIQPYAPGAPWVIENLEVITEIDNVPFFLINDLEVATEIESLSPLTYWYYDQYNVVLLHFDGTDGSPIFLDRSGKPWTAHQDAQLDTSQKVFGSASGLFDGSDAITTPFHTDFIFNPYYGNGLGIDFRIMFHGWPGLMLSHTICCQTDNGYPQNYWRLKFIVDLLGGKKFLFETQNIDYDFGYVRSQSYDFQLDIWYHIALSVNGTGKFLINGVDKTSSGSSFQDVDPININGDFVVGAAWSNGSNGIIAQIDEFSVNRLSRYWYDFTPPTAQYGDAGLTIPGISNLEVLINMDSITFATPPGVLKVNGITGWVSVCGIGDPSKVSGMAS
jgi:hypothetical protein